MSPVGVPLEHAQKSATKTTWHQKLKSGISLVTGITNSNSNSLNDQQQARAPLVLFLWWRLQLKFRIKSIWNVTNALKWFSSFSNTSAHSLSAFYDFWRFIFWKLVCCLCALFRHTHSRRSDSATCCVYYGWQPPIRSLEESEYHWWAFAGRRETHGGIRVRINSTSLLVDCIDDYLVWRAWHYDSDRLCFQHWQFQAIERRGILSRRF
jgi:hypothetical protein